MDVIINWISEAERKYIFCFSSGDIQSPLYLPAGATVAAMRLLSLVSVRKLNILSSQSRSVSGHGSPASHSVTTDLHAQIALIWIRVITRSAHSSLTFNKQHTYWNKRGPWNPIKMETHSFLMLKARLHANAKLEKFQNVFLLTQDATKQPVKRLFPSVFLPLGVKTKALWEAAECPRANMKFRNGDHGLAVCLLTCPHQLPLIPTQGRDVRNQRLDLGSV